jgi:hypothetical protein
LSEATFKLQGWQAQGRPRECGEVKAYRQLIREVIFSVYFKKRAILSAKGMFAQPVSLGEIYLEVRSRILQLRNCGMWPYRVHGKRWVDRRVNECACSKYYDGGIAKIVSVTAGKYEPNQALFVKKPLEASV